MNINRYQFASDNYAGICPEALHAMLRANDGHHRAYGEDQWTQLAIEHFHRVFETACEVFFVFNGTAANSLALASLCQSYHSVVCSDTAHIETDECGAPEFFSNGSKLLLTASDDGRISPTAIRELVVKRNDVHYPKPRVVSITQATELGTVYSVQQVRDISATCKELGLLLHMDGARFANACANGDATPAEMTWKAGVDVLCLGGTKNGMAVGEAIVFFDPAKAQDFGLRCKQAGQLASKMRFLSAPWVGLLENDTWLKHARHANQCAQLLAERLCAIAGLKIKFEPQANSVFVQISEPVLHALRQKGWHFYSFIGDASARFVCSWNTDERSVIALAQDIALCSDTFMAAPRVTHQA